jgi:mono/diheme cytochrome c family protein
MEPKMKLTTLPAPANSWVAHQGCVGYVLISNPMSRFVSRLSAILVAGLGLAGAVRAAAPFDAFLENHCIRCHGPEKSKGDLRIDRLSRDFKLGVDGQQWADVIEQVNSGEMPPKKDKEKKPTQEEIAAFIANLDSQLKEGKAARMAARPAVSHYRLSRKEYQNTVYDLLGVRYDPTKPGELNEDTLWHGFERLGSELTLSPSHVDRYYRAAELVLDRAFPAAASGEARKVQKTAADLRYGGGKDQQAALDRFGIKRPLRWLLFPGTVSNALSPDWFGKIGPQQSGHYRLRLQASGIRPIGGQPAHLSIGKVTGEETVAGLIEFDVTAPEDKPQVYEFEVDLEMPASLSFCVVATDVVDRRAGAAFRNALSGRGYIFTHSSETLLLNQNAPQMFDDKGNGLFSTVLLDWVEWEGPLETDAEKSRRAGLVPADDATPEVVAEHLKRFAERAWRRPVGQEELAEYLKSYRDERDAGENPADAYRVALQGVLTSRNFLYLVEGDPAPREHLNDWELASRLSYFLWSSMPDDALFTAAKGGTLNGEGLKKEVERMVTDSRVNRFVDDFSRQWLQLHRVGMFPPDKKLYPNYDAWLETSMRAEPVEFFREMLAKNLPMDGFLDSNWTMANSRLCDFYGLPEPETSGFQRIALKPEDHRGGLLTMGAALGLTSDGTRHRPVHRGVWLSQVILDKTPPNPPANVPAIEPNPPKSAKASIREKIEAHRADANCAACHAKIDPLGLAWDNYDAIGQWRTRETTAAGVGEAPLINPAGALPDGRAFKDSNEFKHLLIEDHDKFVRAFIEHLSTYGLRRVLSFDDDADLKAIEAEAKKSQGGVKDIVRAVAMSELMRKR